MTGGHAIQEGKGGHGAPIVNLLFQSVGVAFTEVQDVEFKYDTQAFYSYLRLFPPLLVVIVQMCQKKVPTLIRLIASRVTSQI